MNAICPGTVETPSWHDRVNESHDPDSSKKNFIARQALGRLGTPEEISALVTYLASDEVGKMWPEKWKLLQNNPVTTLATLQQCTGCY